MRKLTLKLIKSEAISDPKETLALPNHSRGGHFVRLHAFVRRCIATLHDKLQPGRVEHLNILLYDFEKLLITSQVTTGSSETPEYPLSSLRCINASDSPPTDNT
jgi:hypothetical protein